MLNAYEPRPIGDPAAKRIRELLLQAGAHDDIFAAVRSGEVEAIRAFLDCDPGTVRATSGIGTPLFSASRSGRVEAARLLIERGADVNEPNSANNTPLWFACQSPAPWEDRVAVARVLLDAGADVHRRCEEGSTALHIAAWRGPAEMVELLLSRGARNWIIDDKNKRALDRARESQAAGKAAIVQLLSDVRILDPLFREAVAAINSGNAAILRALLAQHPGLAHQRAEEEGWAAGPYFRHPTLLHFVARNPAQPGSLPSNICEITQALLDAGAAINAVTESPSGSTTLGLVATSDAARDQNLQLPLLELLVRNGADPAAGLDAAILYNAMDAVTALLRLGARHTLSSAAGVGDEPALRAILTHPHPDSSRLAAAGVSAIHGHTGCVEMLLTTGLDINDPIPGHPYSPTLLHQAAWFGHQALAEKLLSLGANRELRDTQYNGAPADWARVNGHPALSELIRNWQ